MQRARVTTDLCLIHDRRIVIGGTETARMDEVDMK